MITNKIQKFLPMLLLSVLLISPLTAIAAIGTSGSGSPIGTSGGGSPIGTSGSGETLVNPLKADSLEELLELVLLAAVRIGTIILVLMIVWVGFLFVAARGNEEKLRTARTAFFWTIIGGLILLGARGIAEVIQSTASTL